MNEQQLVLDRFIKLCTRFPNRRIAIYGVGLNTKYIAQNLKSPAEITCLIDAQKAGTNMYGYQVYAADEIVGVADIVVVVARVAVLHMLYQRVMYLEDSGIEIYNLDGDNLRDYFAHRQTEYEDNPYWESSEAQLKSAIDTHSTVSFDMFDTLLTRMVLRPHDVFDLVERSYEDSFGQKIPFAVNRIEAEHELSLEYVPNFNQIYEQLAVKLGLQSKHMTWLREKEIELEKKLLIPRESIVGIFRYALEKEKTVVIVSDMYFDSAFLALLLESKGIAAKGVEIIVSSEYGTTKESGKLFDILKQRYKDILHIGDNKNADIKQAQNAGLNTYYVMSPSDMLLSSPLCQLMSLVGTIEDSLTLGRFAARVLNSPFSLCEGKSKVSIDSLEVLAEYFAPIMLRFLRWMVQSIGAEKEAVILFMARDGYLMKQLYDYIRCEVLPNLPDSVYFLTSRDALSEKYASLRSNYKKYWETLGISDYKQIFVFETETKGTSISKFGEVFGQDIGHHVKLVCINTFNISATFPFPARIHSYLGDFSFYHLPYAFLKYYELLEILSAPNQTQFLHFDDDMRPIYIDEDMESKKQWHKIALVQDKIIDSLKRAYELDPIWHTRDSNAGMADTILGAISSQSAIANEDIKNIFIFESHFENIEQENWWDRIVKQ